MIPQINHIARHHAFPYRETAIGPYEEAFYSEGEISGCAVAVTSVEAGNPYYAFLSGAKSFEAGCNKGVAVFVTAA